jgi:CHAT domain-containing protein
MAPYLLILILTLSLIGVGDHADASAELAYTLSTREFNHAQFENSRAEADLGYRKSSERQSATHWRLRLALAESLIELDRTEEALPLLENSAPPSEEEARCSADRALIHLRNHEEDETMKCLAKARQNVSASDHELMGKIDLIEGTLQLQKDQVSGAEASFRRALAAVEGSHSLIESYTLSDLGYLDHRRFRYDEAIYWFGRALDLARRNGMQRAADLALGNLGSAYLDLGDLGRAVENFASATALARQLDDRVYEMRWLVGLGETWYRLGDAGKAAECYQKARLLARPESDQQWIADIFDDLSQIALKQGDLASAADLNAQGTAVAATLLSAQPLLTQKIQAAAIAAARREYATAERIYHDTLAANRAAGDPVAWFRCHAGLASLYRQTGAAAKAQGEYQSASADISQLHSSLQQDESKFSLLSSLIDFYRDYVDFLIDRGDIAGAFQVAESSRARVLEERLHRDGARSLSADLNSLQQEARASGGILLSYWLAPRRSLLWVIDSTGLHNFHLPAEAEIAARVRRYNDAVRRGDDILDTRNDAGQWLSANLLATLYRVPKNSNVVIEADGSLHQLNFETLPSQDGGHYWIDDATVSVAPSLALLHRSPYKSGGRLLAFGDPGYSGTEFQDLSNVKTELLAVGSHFTEKALFVSTAATPSAYREAHPENYSTLHFAAHAIANHESPLDSAIVLAGPADSRKLYAREILRRPLSAELVTLSACQSAGSRTYYGEGLTGFSWAFLSAGARNVVAGLWDVDDRATSILMKDFYDELAAGMVPAVALRRAKMDLMALAGVYRKPRYWAAFETFTRALY